MSNKTYMCIMRSESGTCESKGKSSPEDMEKMYTKFNTWKETYKDNILDMGGKLGEGKVVNATSITDGPFFRDKELEAKEIVGGYMILSAKDIDEATKVAQESPGTSGGASVEVREIHIPS